MMRHSLLRQAGASALYRLHTFATGTVRQLPEGVQGAMCGGNMGGETGG